MERIGDDDDQNDNDDRYDAAGNQSPYHEFSHETADNVPSLANGSKLAIQFLSREWFEASNTITVR
jgi:hypothetical protein